MGFRLHWFLCSFFESKVPTLLSYAIYYCLRLKQQMITLLVLVPALVLALACARFIVNWRSLSKAPGPALAGSTDLWRAYQQYNGKLRQNILDLHSQYGPIVRYGVRSISINDPEVINVVYGSRAGFVTVGTLPEPGLRLNS